MDISYKINNSTQKDIHDHLVICDTYFDNILSSRVNLDEFSEKIYTKAIRFEAWYEKKLIGLISAYFTSDVIGFINHVAVFTRFQRKGISRILLQSCIDYGKKNNYKFIHLEINSKNKKAMDLYKSFNFVVLETSDDNIKMRKDIRNGKRL
jgi:ribosomal protein S18 acetylase RimI-like enzyme